MPFADARVALDLRRIADMPEVPLILEVCREASGMPFVAIARAAEGADGRWVTCAAYDALGLGTMPGNELQIASVLHRLAQTDRSLVVVGGTAKLEANRAALEAGRDTVRLRGAFIAVVGHDLRNPIAAVSAGLRILGRHPTKDKASHLVVEMQRSMLRMQQIVDDLLDFARGRLGAGIELEAIGTVDLEPVLRDVAQEVERLSGLHVEAAIDLPRPIRCDPQRIAQLFSNFQGNAMTHGSPARVIRIRASDEDDRFRLAVSNYGTPIPEDVIPGLFLPFSRGGGTGRACLQGLGLGLYIAAEISPRLTASCME